MGIGFWVGVTGCGESEAWGPRTGALSDSSGIQIVVHPPLGRYGSRAQAVEYLWEVPESAGGGPVDFGFVGDVELLPDGRIAVLDQYAANIRVFSAPGELVHTLGRRGPGPGREDAQWLFNELPTPDTLPAFRSLQVDEAGWIWAEVFHWDMTRQSGDWMIFDPEGRAQGILTAPEDLQIQRIGEDFLLGVWWDDWGIEHVRKYSLTREPTD